MRVLRLARGRLWLAGLLGEAGLASAQGAEPAAAPRRRRRTPRASSAPSTSIQRRYEAVRDLSADFVQTTRSVALGGPGSAATSHGTVVFAKPGKMRWAYDDPEPSLVVSDGHWLWIYDPAHQEVQKLAGRRRLPVGSGDPVPARRRQDPSATSR